MNSQERLMAQLRELCAEPGPEDGAERPRRRRQQHGDLHSTRIAGRVAHAVSLALGASSDLQLAGLVVLGGRPAPDAACVAVHVVAPGVSDAEELDALHARLRSATGSLREEVAHHINGRRTPRLVFVVEPEPEGAT